MKNPLRDADELFGEEVSNYDNDLTSKFSFEKREKKINLNNELSEIVHNVRNLLGMNIFEITRIDDDLPLKHELRTQLYNQAKQLNDNEKKE